VTSPAVRIGRASPTCSANTILSHSPVAGLAPRRGGVDLNHCIGLVGRSHKGPDPTVVDYVGDLVGGQPGRDSRVVEPGVVGPRSRLRTRCGSPEEGKVVARFEAQAAEELGDAVRLSVQLGKRHGLTRARHHDGRPIGTFDGPASPGTGACSRRPWRWNLPERRRATLGPVERRVSQDCHTPARSFGRDLSKPGNRDQAES
jgi:hypothetical protein